MAFFVHQEAGTLVHFYLQGHAWATALLCNLITWRTVDSYGLRSKDQLLLSVPFAMEHAAKRLENN